jgi:hypothetical protein
MSGRLQRSVEFGAVSSFLHLDPIHREGDTSLRLTTPAMIRIPTLDQQVGYAGSLAAAHLRKTAEIAGWAARGVPTPIPSRPTKVPEMARVTDLPVTPDVSRIKLPSIGQLVELAPSAPEAGAMVVIATALAKLWSLSLLAATIVVLVLLGCWRVQRRHSSDD